MPRAGVLTVSDSASAGKRQDESGPLLRGILAEKGFEIVHQGIVPDDRCVIANTLRSWIDGAGVDLIVTTGGTGLSPRDVTPEATASVMEKEIPGIGEAVRRAGLKSTPMAMLSRGIAGICSKTLIINLPGSPKAVSDGMSVVLPVLNHAIAKMKGDMTPCHKQVGTRNSGTERG